MWNILRIKTCTDDSRRNENKNYDNVDGMKDFEDDKAYMKSNDWCDAVKECKNDIECKSFLHQASTQKCWLKDDTNFEPETDYTFVGPKECPAKASDGRELMKTNETQSIQN